MIINIVIEILVSKLDVYNSFDQDARCVTVAVFVSQHDKRNAGVFRAERGCYFVPKNYRVYG